MRTKVIAFVILVILLIPCATPAYGQELPPLPHAFYGTVTINNSPAPIGTKIEARGEGVRTGIEGNPIVTTTIGSYGSPDPMGPKLIVQGDILDGTTITFYVNGVSTEQTAEWHSGEVTEINLSATIAVPPTPPGGGGGGGAPPPPTLPPGTTSLQGLINYRGVFNQNVIALSFDSKCRLIISKDTVGLTWYGGPLNEIKMIQMEAAPAPPENAHIIGLVYDLKPDRATFNPAATLEYSYDPSNIPEGIAEQDLVLAWWDASASQWVELDSTVDVEANTITAPISHFTGFTALAYEPALKPAAFSLSSLTISPSEVAPGESVTISTEVANTGDVAGSYKVTLKINGVVEATKEITVNAGDSQKVNFTTSRDVAGTYSVDINGLSGSFTVRKKAAPPPPTPTLPAPPPAPINWPAIWSVVGGVIIAGIIIFLTTRRKRKA